MESEKSPEFHAGMKKASPLRGGGGPCSSRILKRLLTEKAADISFQMKMSKMSADTEKMDEDNNSNSDMDTESNSSGSGDEDRGYDAENKAPLLAPAPVLVTVSDPHRDALDALSCECENCESYWALVTQAVDKIQNTLLNRVLVREALSSEWQARQLVCERARKTGKGGMVQWLQLLSFLQFDIFK